MDNQNGTVWALPDETLESIESLYDLNLDDFDDIDSWLAYEGQVWDWAWETDTLAQEHGTLVGRCFTRPVADGKALYMVWQHDEGEKLVDVLTIPIRDSYQDSTIAAMDNQLAEKVVQKFLDQEIAIRELFGSRD